MNKKIASLGLLNLLIATLLTGCGAIPYKAYTNNVKSNPGVQDSSQASFVLRDTRITQTSEGPIDCNPKKHKDVLVMLALSGGGSRAALMSGLAMLELQNIKIKNSDVLSEVDLISSVSGGSLAAAYYASSGDPIVPDAKDVCHQSYSGRVWDQSTVSNAMAKDYLWRWVGNWFWPDNILLYWFSTYDRTDMMAQTLADNLYDTKGLGIDISFSDMNPERPNLILNATQGSSNTDEKPTFGQPFTFTSDDFNKRICSTINDYNLARGVMATATFPGVFNFMTLRNYCVIDTKKYIHVAGWAVSSSCHYL